MNYRAYYKIMNCVRKRDIKIAYIKSTNIVNTRKEIAYKIKSQVKDDLITAC